ncbi:hypothetical protein [Paraburkholderia sp. J67]|nr:hypothetical protein [Paraburkholderia sp. J67]
MSRQPNLFASPLAVAALRATTYALASSVGVKAKAKKQSLI